jgi:flagellar hook-associated protein 2
MSSPITLTGFNGIDFKSIVDILMTAARQPLNDLNTQKTTTQTKLTTYGTLVSNLSSLKSAFDALADSTSYGQLAASASDSSVLTASATSDATKGTSAINVTSLASPQVTASTDDLLGGPPTYGRISDINATVITGGSFSITPHGGNAVPIDLTGVQSLAQLRDAINVQQSETGVVASIINDGVDPERPFRLVLTSTSSGTAHDFSWSDGLVYVPGFNLNLATDPTTGSARDSVFTYNGIQIRSSSTRVSDAIPGLTLELLKEGSTSVTVSSDQSSLRDGIDALVTAFNSFNDFTGQQRTSGSALYGDSLLRGANRDLRSFLVSAHPNSGVFQYLAELGIELDRNGKLQINDSLLSDALANHPDDAKAFLSGTSGFAAQISAVIDNYSASWGTIAGAEGRLKSTISSYDTRIQTLEAQLVIQEQTLNQQFTAADQAISQLNAEISALTALENQYRLF